MEATTSPSEKRKAISIPRLLLRGRQWSTWEDVESDGCYWGSFEASGLRVDNSPCTVMNMDLCLDDEFIGRLNGALQGPNKGLCTMQISTMLTGS